MLEVKFYIVPERPRSLEKLEKSTRVVWGPAPYNDPQEKATLQRDSEERRSVVQKPNEITFEATQPEPKKPWYYSFLRFFKGQSRFFKHQS